MHQRGGEASEGLQSGCHRRRGHVDVCYVRRRGRFGGGRAGGWSGAGAMGWRRDEAAESDRSRIKNRIFRMLHRRSSRPRPCRHCRRPARPTARRRNPRIANPLGRHRQLKPAPAPARPPNRVAGISHRPANPPGEEPPQRAAVQSRYRCAGIAKPRPFDRAATTSLFRMVVKTNQVLIPVRVTDDSGRMTRWIAGQGFRGVRGRKKADFELFHAATRLRCPRR